MNFKSIFELLKDTFSEWNVDRAPRLGAALAFYTILSIAPLLVTIVIIVGTFFGQDEAQTQLLAQAQDMMGEQVAETLRGLIENANKPGAGLVASILSGVTLLFGASGVFGELQSALNVVWGVQPRPDRGIMGMVMQKLLAFALVLSSGLLLLASILINSVLSALNDQVSGFLPGSDIIWQVVNLLVPFAISILIFALIYKFVPDVIVSWRDVFIGATFTSVLFALGRFLLGWYLSNSGSTSVYGAAGSLVVFLLWIFYSAQIFFFGAEFTQVYAHRFGGKILPSKNAVAVGKWRPDDLIAAADGGKSK